MDLTGYEIYSIPQLKEWLIRALVAGDKEFAETCRQAIKNKETPLTPTPRCDMMRVLPYYPRIKET